MEYTSPLEFTSSPYSTCCHQYEFILMAIKTVVLDTIRNRRFPLSQVTANFTTDMTPLILAAQRNNYEILKMLLDRGASIPMPHDVKCSCDECVEESTDDSLRFR